MTHYARVSEKEVEQAATLLAKGMLWPAIAKKIGREANTLKYQLVRRGIYKPGTNCDYDAIDYAEVKRQYEAGASWGDLSKEYGAVGRVLKEHMLRHYPKVRIRTLAEQHSFDSDRRWQERRSQAMSKQDFNAYKREAYRQTRLAFKKWKHVIDPKGLKHRNSGYHVDHCLSVQHAAYNYTNPLRIRLIAHPANLRVITGAENISKKDKSIYTLAQLKARIKKFEAKFGPAF